MMSDTLPGTMPVNWNDDDYLARHPDVKAAVLRRDYASGYAHYLDCGRREGRSGGWGDAALQRPMTRACLDPWTYVEITPTFKVKPCCKIPGGASVDNDGDIATVRQNDYFNGLRQGLMTGNLDPHCQACHIRPMVPTDRFRQYVEEQGASATRPLPLENIRVELTTRCNLRCTYCPVSKPEYQGQDLAEDNFSKITDIVVHSSDKARILVNGHGETTFHPRWMEFCRPLLDLGKHLSIITNLSLHLDDDEVGTLSRFQSIEVSMDTVDADLLRRIRRKVLLKTIVDNFTRIREAAAAGGRPAPVFSISCGVYDKNIEGIPDLCAFAIQNRFRKVTFWQLVKYDDVPDGLNVYPIDSLPQPAIDRAIAVMDHAIGLLRRYGVGSETAGGFLDSWKKQRQRVAQSA